MKHIIIMLATIAVAGCIPDLADLEPDVGDLLVRECENVDQNSEVEVSFSRDLLGGLFRRETSQPPMWDPPNTCIKCHDPSNGALFGAEYGGFDISSYRAMMQGGVNSGTDIVIPEQPCESLLYLKLSAAVPFGSRMPMFGPNLTEEDMALLADWIAEGANDN